MKFEDLYREVMLDYAKNPTNFGLIENDESFHKVSLKNPSCGDEITMQIKIENNTITKINQKGKGCTICCAAASYAIKLFENKKLDEIKIIFDSYYKLVKGEEINKEILGNEAEVFKGVANFPARVRCATISWKALEEAIKEYYER